MTATRTTTATLVQTNFTTTTKTFILSQTIHLRDATPTVSIPTYLSACSGESSRLSSACSCYIGTRVETTTTQTTLVRGETLQVGIRLTITDFCAKRDINSRLLALLHGNEFADRKSKPPPKNNSTDLTPLDHENNINHGNPNRASVHRQHPYHSMPQQRPKPKQRPIQN
jgi:hypothetical protein